MEKMTHTIDIGTPIVYNPKREPMTQKQYLDTFRALTQTMVDTTTRKNNDYAGTADPFANFREFGTFGFLVRMSDKWKRIKNLVGENRPPAVKDETVEDTLIDLAIYCLLLICWLRDQK